MRSFLLKSLLAAFLLVAAFLGGRFSKPDKVLTVHEKGEVQVVEKEKIVYRDRVSKTHSETTKTVEKKPDGSVVETTKTVADSGSETKTDTKETVDSTKTTITKDSKLVENAKPGWRVAGQMGLSVGSLTKSDLRSNLVYGLQVDRRIAGTVWLGVWGRTDKTAGVSLGLEF